MNSNTRISAKALLAAAALAASPSAWSLGLGDATVESYLNQPLRARIDLVTQENDDLASVSAKLASAADYELIGASLEDLALPVRFTVENIGGDAFLLASSQLPVSNPVVRLIVEVNWSSGRMLREYTLFLDPPMASDEAAPLPRIDQRETVQEPAPVVDQAAPPPVRDGRDRRPDTGLGHGLRPGAGPVRPLAGGRKGGAAPAALVRQDPHPRLRQAPRPAGPRRDERPVAVPDRRRPLDPTVPAGREGGERQQPQRPPYGTGRLDQRADLARVLPTPARGVSAREQEPGVPIGDRPHPLAPRS